MKNRILVILLAILLFPSFGHAQWVQTNGPANKRIHALAAINAKLFAGTDSGVFYTSDLGASWSQSGLKSVQVNSLAVIDTDLFASTTDSGVFITTNNGTDWMKVDSGLSGVGGHVDALFASETNLFATANNGVFRSTDRGTSWAFFNNGLTNYSIFDFAAIGTNIFAGTEHGVCRSTDSGETWVPLNPIVPMDTFLYISVLVTQGTNLFAGTSDYGVFLSTDSGNTWIVTSNEVQTLFFDAFLAFGPNLFAGIESSFILLSTDSGKSWADVSLGWSNPPFYTTSFAVIDSILFAGTDIGVWREPISEMIEPNASVSTHLSMESIQAYPNPFSQSTTIAFTSPESGVAEVSVVNILGVEVARIFSGELDAGEHSFSWDASALPPGMYECVVSINGNVQRIPLSHLR